MNEATRVWGADEVLEMSRTYQAAAVIAAAADLEVFDRLHPAGALAEELAATAACDARGMRVLLDALAALGLLHKSAEHYTLAAGVAECLTRSGSASVLAMVQHQANCMRRWAHLAWAVKDGGCRRDLASIRGEQADEEAFIEAMDNISARVAPQVIQGIGDLGFRHLLDIGGASGTWTIAFLRARPGATATLFDLPEVIPMARRRLEAAGLADRVQLVSGDYRRDPFPPGADLAWVSAIVHQNSRLQNRSLFANAFSALCPDSRIAVRDILMERCRTRPVAGALFAVNMLVGTESGGTYTFDELREDLESAGFQEARLTRPDPGMNAVMSARKPAA